jgi:hypothetical protein
MENDTGQPSRPTKKRSLAWIYYAIIASICAFIGFNTTAGLLVPAALCALYSVYLFRGGRFVVWIW